MVGRGELEDRVGAVRCRKGLIFLAEIKTNGLG
jgi:hypothetical protein